MNRTTTTHSHCNPFLIVAATASLCVAMVGPSVAMAQNDRELLYCSNGKYVSPTFEYEIKGDFLFINLRAMFTEYLKEHYDPLIGYYSWCANTSASNYSFDIKRARDWEGKVVITEWTPQSVPERGLYTFCVCRDPVSREYLSDIFLVSETFDSETIAAQFSDFIQAAFDFTCRSTPCTNIMSKSEAILEHEKMVEDYHLTGWRPEGFLEPNPLRDFDVTVAEDDREVQVCVRDHECEDGDRVRVRVNDRTIFDDHELFNNWACESVPVKEGENSIELYAINGSGRKGNCDYRDANTGQIRVEGTSVDTQGWKHQGGAGSNASIVVTVD